MKTTVPMLKKKQPFGKFSGKDLFRLFGPNLDDYEFACADLRDTNWAGIESANNIDLRCANLDGANLAGIVTAGWNCVGTSMRGAVLDGVKWQALAHGAILAGASMRNITWTRGGFAAGRGIVLPEYVPFSTWTGGAGFHAGIARLLDQEFPNDLEIGRAIDFILAQPQRQYYDQPFPCWRGFVRMCHQDIPKAIDRIMAMFGRYPAMGLETQWKVAERQIREASRVSRSEQAATRHGCGGDLAGCG